MKRLLFAIAICALLGGTALAGPASITLTGTIRDFLDTHPDMEAELGTDPGIVQASNISGNLYASSVTRSGCLLTGKVGGLLLGQPLFASLC